ncbi:MAG: hypothetical protein RIQ89_2286 [Bacteroidota bacterium]|jgi:leucine-rich repeat protein SHOC2
MNWIRVLGIFLLLFPLQLHAQLVSDSNYIYRSVSVAAANPENVFRINLSKTKLDKIPDEIFQFTKLRSLILSKNNISILEESIVKLSALEELDLSNNELQELPLGICQLQNLKVLKLNRNLLAKLPDCIGNMENLEVLELWDNELSALPESMTELKKLKLLELRGILFSDEEHERILSLLPNCTIFISPPCNCKF